MDKMSTSDSVVSSKKVADSKFASIMSESVHSEISNTEGCMKKGLEEIYTWIDEIPFSRPRKNIARDFSDAVFMAELLKKYYSRHVDLHNYVSRNSIVNKIDNWNNLNRKVLSKIGMKLDKGTIMRLANSESGVIENILAGLRSKILKDCNNERNLLYFDYEENGKGDTVKSVLDQEEIANATVPRRAFVKLKRELLETKSAMSTLSDKLEHFESLVKLKDARIADLTAQITGQSNKNETY